MIKDYILVQSGIISPLKFKRDEITRRSCVLGLSRYQDVESVHTGGVNYLDVDKSENRYLLSACSDGSIYIHDLYNFSGRPHYTAKCICKVTGKSEVAHRHSVECISWYGEENELFITSGADKTVKVWDANSMKPAENYKCKGRIFHHDCTAVPTRQPILAVASSVKHVELIDLRAGSGVHELRGHNSSVLACCWSPASEHLLATGGIDNKILLWDVRSSSNCLKILDRYNGKSSIGTAHSGYVNGLRFTDDGLLLLSFGSDNRLRLWETLHGNHQMINYGKIKNDVKRHSEFAIASDSNPPLAYVPSEGNVYVVEIFTGRTVRVLHGHFNSVNCSYYRRGHQELYTGGKDRNVIMWTADDSQREMCSENVMYEEKSRARTTLLRILDNWSSDEDSMNITISPPPPRNTNQNIHTLNIYTLI